MDRRDPSPGGPVSFDRAVEYYDRTRALPEELMRDVVDLLTRELRGRGTTLEIGVGTGRMALPLHAAGTEMIGLDISKQMMDRLVERAGRMPFPLLVADARRLPFATNTLAAGIAAHVLHLISDWRRVLDELVRVIAKGGVLLVDLGHESTGRMRELTGHWTEAAGIETMFPGILEADALDDAMRARGARVRELPELRGSKTLTYEDAIGQYEAGLWSFTWKASEEDRRKASADTRRWVEANIGPLDATFENEVRVAWRAYDV